MSELKTANQQLIELRQRVRYASPFSLHEFDSAKTQAGLDSTIESLTKTIIACVRALAAHLWGIRENATESKLLLDDLINRRRNIKSLELLLCFDSKQMRVLSNSGRLQSSQGLPGRFVVPFADLENESLSQTLVGATEESSNDFMTWWRSTPSQVTKQFKKYFSTKRVTQYADNPEPLFTFYTKHQAYESKVRIVYNTINASLSSFENTPQRKWYSLVFAEAALVQLSSKGRVVVFVTEEEKLLNLRSLTAAPLMGVPVSRPSVIELITRMLGEPLTQFESVLDFLRVKSERLREDADRLIRETHEFVDASDFSNAMVDMQAHAFWKSIATNSRMQQDMLPRLFGDLDRLSYSCLSFEREWGSAIAVRDQSSTTILNHQPNLIGLPRVPRNITAEGGTDLKKQIDLTLICNVRTTNCERFIEGEVLSMSEDPVRICCFDGEELMFAFTGWISNNKLSGNEKDSTMLQLEFTPRKTLGDLWDKTLEFVVQFMKENQPHKEARCDATFEETVVSIEFDSEENDELLTQLRWSQLSKSAKTLDLCSESSSRPQILQAVELTWSRLAIYVQEFKDEPERIFSVSFPLESLGRSITSVLIEILSHNDPSLDQVWLEGKVSHILGVFSDKIF